jgi:hypothetical protein
MLLFRVGGTPPALSAADLGGAQHATLFGRGPRSTERPMTKFTAGFLEWAPDERRPHEAAVNGDGANSYIG